MILIYTGIIANFEHNAYISPILYADEELH